MGFGRGAIRSGFASVSGRAPLLNLQAFLDERLRQELVRCGGVPGSAHLDLETTLDEIVSVTGDVASLDALASSCLMEAAWALPLPTAFYETWATFHVAL